MRISAVGGFIFLFGMTVLCQQAVAQGLPCTPAKPDDPQPWVHTWKVLDSFPKDNPPPRFLGAFENKRIPWSYRLWLYRDSKGVFGQLSTPLLEADPPTSRLYEPTYNPTNGKLQFRSRFQDEELYFTGVLTGNRIVANIKGPLGQEKLTLRSMPANPGDGWVTSRAAFECAMTLWRRF